MMKVTLLITIVSILVLLLGVPVLAQELPPRGPTNTKSPNVDVTTNPDGTITVSHTNKSEHDPAITVTGVIAPGGVVTGVTMTVETNEGRGATLDVSISATDTPGKGVKVDIDATPAND